VTKPIVILDIDKHPELTEELRRVADDGEVLLAGERVVSHATLEIERPRRSGLLPLLLAGALGGPYLGTVTGRYGSRPEPRELTKHEREALAAAEEKRRRRAARGRR
jgi:hypothetical protein